MSIEKTRQGRWAVRWREGGRNRSRVVDRKRDAERLDAEVRRRRQLGELATIDGGRMTVDDLAVEWWRRHAEPNLAASTRAAYRSTYDGHVHPRVGAVPIRELGPRRVARLASDMDAAGVGGPTRRKALAVLGSLLQYAVEQEYVAANPVRMVRKPGGGRPRAVRPLAPAAVEAMRAALDTRDATLVSVLAYAGLRPGEALALRWADVGARTLLVERAVSLDGEGPTKTRRHRAARLLPALRHDMAEWRLASGRPGDDALVFPARDGGPWTHEAYKSWARRTFARAAATAGHPDATPYTLRHSCASLAIHEGRSVIEVASWLGHSPEVCLRTYSHVMADLGDERRSAEAEIAAARDGSVRLRYVEGSAG